MQLLAEAGYDESNPLQITYKYSNNGIHADVATMLQSMWQAIGVDAVSYTHLDVYKRQGHTVVNEYGKFALNLLPSGIFHSGTLNLLGAGVVVDLKHIHEEIGRLRCV